MTASEEQQPTAAQPAAITAASAPTCRRIKVEKRSSSDIRRAKSRDSACRAFFRAFRDPEAFLLLHLRHHFLDSRGLGGFRDFQWPGTLGKTSGIRESECAPAEAPISENVKLIVTPVDASSAPAALILKDASPEDPEAPETAATPPSTKMPLPSSIEREPFPGIG
eukprot:CAMPEP_0179837692 /NCGR_PEP_ID=MMETSP0982-20121206/188_1 /TAXON_ID=483367 /ORGANISM="non described non described, Strain CCMP 2436" /LENGTH=165 /DNA_ID=CAMNT_0021720833 /DNA_START=263 /DNA_END=761 /DNA_ORIENTATION=-